MGVTWLSFYVPSRHLLNGKGEKHKNTQSRQTNLTGNVTRVPIQLSTRTPMMKALGTETGFLVVGTDGNC
jgi:hypothetical protein